MDERKIEQTAEHAGADMKVRFGVCNEISEKESRVALTPDMVGRLAKAGVSCFIEEGAGRKADFGDQDYRASGAQVVDRDELVESSDALGFVGRPDRSLLESLRAGTWVLGMLGSLQDQDYVSALAKTRVVALAMERLPRQLSSAQSMDEMSSQSSVMGYKAALLAANEYSSFFPMMTTAAGTIRPAKVLVLGAGIAGLQCIGTAKRLGAVVTAYDVRLAAREEIESLGAKFLDTGLDFSHGQGEGGYARELTDEEQAAQQDAVDRKATDFDIIITTAKVPGRKPPLLLTKAGVGNLHRGTVVVDCAASDLGGNVEGSIVGSFTSDGGVRIIGEPNLASQVPTTASMLLSRNLADVLIHCVHQGRLSLDPDDEIDRALVIQGPQENKELGSIR